VLPGVVRGELRGEVPARGGGPLPRGFLRTTPVPIGARGCSGQLAAVDGVVAGLADHGGLTPFLAMSAAQAGWPRPALPRLPSFRTWCTSTLPVLRIARTVGPGACRSAPCAGRGPVWGCGRPRPRLCSMRVVSRRTGRPAAAWRRAGRWLQIRSVRHPGFGLSSRGHSRTTGGGPRPRRRDRTQKPESATAPSAAMISVGASWPCGSCSA